MTATFTWDLPMDSTAAAIARQHVGEVASTDSDVVDAELIASELVTNAWAHGHGTGAITMTITVAEDVMRIEVCSDSDGVPHHEPRSDESPDGRGLLLIGVLDKVGTFGMIRYCLPIFPAASEFYAPVVIGMALIGIFYGAYVALTAQDMRRLFAYSSMSHFGFIALGIFVFTSSGQSGSVVYMVAHGLSTAALFLTAGFLMSRRRDSALISDYGGVNKVAPVLAGFFLVAALSSLALPGLASFVGEFLVLLGAFERYLWVGALGTLGIVITAAYVLRLYQKSMTGPANPSVEGMTDLKGREITALVPIAALSITLGLYPAPLLNVINPAVDWTMNTISAVDPEPVVSSDGSQP